MQIIQNGFTADRFNTAVTPLVGRRIFTLDAIKSNVPTMVEHIVIEHFCPTRITFRWAQSSKLYRNTIIRPKFTRTISQVDLYIFIPQSGGKVIIN